MAFALNQTPPTGADAIWTLIQTALNPLAPGAAWTVARSGGGTGGVYTICGLVQTGPAGLANPFSWFVLRSPGYTTSPIPFGGALYHRELCFQRGADNASWRVKYSARAGFSGGVPSFSQTPSATDEQVIVGGGTDAVPTFGALLPADGSYRMQLNIYEDLLPGLYLVTYPLGNPVPNACLLLDALEVGSFPTDDAGNPLEQDPVVLYQRTGADTLRAASLASELTGPVGWLNYPRTLPPAQAFVRLPATYLGVYDSAGVAQQAIPVGLAQTILADDIDTGRATYVRRAILGGTTGRKGDASGWRWNGILGAAGGQLISQRLAGFVQPYFWLTLGDVLLRWDCQTKEVLL